MKLIVQIPCFNEAGTLAATVAEIPRRIDGFDRVEVLVVDDGSTDGTSAIARAAGVDHIVRHASNRGLALAFRSGLEAALRLGADVVVNTDGDGQYPGAAIPELVRPILDLRADLVIGDRQTQTIPHFSPLKKLLQRLGSALVRRLSGTSVPDAVSGFRAFSRNAALRVNVVSSFSYTIETLIQAGQARLAVVSIPIVVNPQSRASRLYGNVGQFLLQSMVTIVRTYTMYKPLRVFLTTGAVLLVLGAAPVVRFVIFFVDGQGSGHIQSLVVGVGLLVSGFMTVLFGMLADLVAGHRVLTEAALEKLRRLDRDSPGPGAS